MQREQIPQNSIRVFGEHNVRVEPDRVSLQFLVSRNAPGAEEAINNAQKSSTEVQAYLKEANIEQLAVSQVDMNTTHTNIPNTLDYQANILFHVILEDLEHFSEILIGIVDAGANTILATDFQSSQIESIRAEARNTAMRVARERAEALCEGAQARLGRVVRIDDRGFTQPVQQSSRFGNNQQSRFGNNQAVQGFDMRGADQGKAVNPASILVSMNVEVLFEIESTSD